MLYYLGINKKKSMYVHYRYNIFGVFSIQDWLNLQMWSPGIWKANSMCIL